MSTGYVLIFRGISTNYLHWERIMAHQLRSVGKRRNRGGAQMTPSQSSLTSHLGEPLSYDAFRTGLTFETVFWMIKVEAQAAEVRGERMFFGRNTVLGRWREIKLKMYEYYLSDLKERARLYKGIPF